MNLKHLSAMGALAVAIPMLVNGCSAADALCCTDYKVGADMSAVDFGVDASIKGQFTVLANVSGDLSAAATDMMTDVGNACRDISIDLGATKEEQAAVTAKAPRDQVTDWCNLAFGKLKASGSANVKVTIQPVKCEASFSAQASCQGGCQVDAKCDAKAKPPTCSGKLEVSCKGSCEAKAGATTPSISCTGSCSGKCEGSCTAQGGVECKGACDGKCEASAGGSGSQADGTCQGKCSGTCKATAPGVKCEGQCQGSCDAKCEATPGSASASVKCDGECKGTAEPISCKGGELKASCEVNAKCDANCKASASAKASCEPPSISIVATGSANVDALIATLKLNLPKLVAAIKGKGQAIVDGTGTLVANASGSLDPGKLGVKGSACLVAIASTVGEAAQNAQVSLSAGANVTGAIGN